MVYRYPFFQRKNDKRKISKLEMDEIVDENSNDSNQNKNDNDTNQNENINDSNQNKNHNDSKQNKNKTKNNNNINQIIDENNDFNLNFNQNMGDEYNVIYRTNNLSPTVTQYDPILPDSQLNFNRHPKKIINGNENANHQTKRQKSHSILFGDSENDTDNDNLIAFQTDTVAKYHE